MKATRKNGCKKLIFAMITVGIAVLIAGCQTTIPVSYVEPARIDMGGISRIGMISNDSSAAATVSNALTNTGKYTVVDGKPEIDKLEAWQQLKAYYSNAIEINANDLVSAYNSNAIRANSNYRGKTLVVNGTITDFEENAIRLGVGKDAVDVYIEDSEREKAASLEKGSTVTIIGKCYGLDRPDLKDTGKILQILGGGQQVNIARATFYAPPEDYIANIDAILYLTIKSSDKLDTREVKKPATDSEGNTIKDADGNTVYKNVIEYCRTADVTAAYEVDNLSGEVIGDGRQSGSSSSGYNEDRKALTSTASLIDSAKKKILPKVISDLIPTEKTVSVVLEKSDSKDQGVKTAMSEAKKLVGEKDYAAAAESYGKIYAQSKDFAAGYNQAILTEVAKNTDEAIVLMQALVKSNGNPKAQTMLKEMEIRSAKNKKSAEQSK